MCHYPYKSMETARGIKKTPFYDRCLSKGAVFKDVSGWEVPDWYGEGEVQDQVQLISSSGKHNHSDNKKKKINHVINNKNNKVNNTSEPSTATITNKKETVTDNSSITPAVYALQNQPPVYSFQKPYFFENWKKEHQTCRQGVVVFDMSFMSKFYVLGKW